VFGALMEVDSDFLVEELYSMTRLVEEGRREEE